MKQDILIGCVADDFTGASDAASFLMSKGMKMPGLYAHRPVLSAEKHLSA